MGEIDRVQPTFAPPSSHRGPFAAQVCDGRRPPRESRRDEPGDHLELHEAEADHDGREPAEETAKAPPPPEPRLDLSA